MSAFLKESWTWYGVTWLAVAARMYSRILLLGTWRKLQFDDALMLVAMITDTVLMVSINIVATTSSNLIDPNDPTPLTPDNIKERIFGSKMVLVVEEMQILTTWMVKACILIFYYRLTLSLRQNIAVKIVAAYVALGFVLMEILYLGVWCRPFHMYWAVPSNNSQCTAATHHLIVNAVLNISSDLMIMIIPMPVFIQAGISAKKKALLCSVFAVGGFTIISAVLNKYYSFSDPFGSQWVFWYVRESSTALISANLSQMWTLARRVLRLVTNSEMSSSNMRYASNLRYGSSAMNFPSRPGATATFHSTARRGDAGTVIETSSSQERINRPGDAIPLKIYKRREVDIAYSESSDKTSNQY